MNPSKNFANPLLLSTESQKEELANPFENGLLRQSNLPLELPSEVDEKIEPPSIKDRYGRKTGGMPSHKSKHKDKVNKENLSSDDELLTNMLQDITSKSQERRKPR